MLPMPPADSTSSTIARRARRAAGLLAALAAFASTGLAFAETGAPLPQGYTGDVNAAPQSAPAAQQAGYPTDDDQQGDQAQPPQQDQASDGYADNDPSALTDFQQPLAGHGQWVQDPTYGTVWVPDSAEVGADFAPYQSAGQWTTDDDGEWMWQSDYDWGYIPFHYGRWVWAGGYWGWIPGRRYAPAWVSWRVGEGGYLGWAPMPPTWYWGAGGVAVGLWAAPWAAYCFVPTGYAFNRGVGAYVVRDRGTIQAAAAGTRPYHPASPGVGHGVSPGPHGHMSPSMAEAHVSASAAAHAHADTRAMSYASRSATAAAQRSSFGRGLGQGGARHGDAWHTQYDGFGRARNNPGLRTPSSGESFHAGGPSYYRSAPSYYRGTPSFHASGPAYYGGQHYASPGGARSFGGGGYHPPSRAAGRFSGGHSGGGHHGGGHR